MSITKVIEQLSKIKEQYGDIQIGSSSCSPDEGWVYAMYDIDVHCGHQGWVADLLFDNSSDESVISGGDGIILELDDDSEEE